MILEKLIDDEPDFAVLGMHFFSIVKWLLKSL